MKLSRPKSGENTFRPFRPAMESSPTPNPRRNYLAMQREKAVEIQNKMVEEISKISKRSTGKNKSRQISRRDILEKVKLRKMIFSEALDKVIDQHSEICDLLSEIRCEYEAFLDALMQGENQYHFIYEQLKKMTTDPITLELLRKRRDELEKKIAILNENNQKVSDQISKVSQSIKTQSEKSEDMNENEQSKKGYAANNMHLTKEAFSIIGAVSLPGATDVYRLSAYSAKLENKIQTVNLSLKNQYTTKTKQVQLQERFSKEENTQHHLMKYNSKLKDRFEKLKLSIEVRSLYLSVDKL